MARVLLKNIYKVYGNNMEAVKDISLEIEDKEFVVLVGPSGCGKSTTLRMIAGLEEITKGELYIDDKLVNDMAAKDRDIAMVFQNYALYPHMTVFENMAFGLTLRKVDKKEIEKRVLAASKILDIEEYLKRKPKELSGGQRQRVAIGRAIVREPKVFLMDEPLSNLDAKLRTQMRAEILKLHKKLNATFIYVTHDQIEAMTLGTKIVVMKDGIVQQSASPQQVFENPRNVFVAGFIGTPQMNFIKGNVIKNNDNYIIRVLGKDLKISQKTIQQLNERKIKECEVVVGIRPEHIYLNASEENSLKAEVELIELIGSESYLHLNIDNKTFVARIDSDVNISRGDKVNVSFLENKIHLFDVVTEENLLV